MGLLAKYLVDWAHQNPAIFWSTVSVGGYHLVAAAIDSLDAPGPQSGGFYRWFYKFANRVAANYSRNGGKP
jgi:hypothetical protein